MPELNDVINNEKFYNVSIITDGLRSLLTINVKRPDEKTQVKYFSGEQLINRIRNKEPYITFQRSRVDIENKDPLIIIKITYGLGFLDICKIEERFEITV